MASISSSSIDNSIAYTNGRVYTIDASKPWAEAFIVGPDGIFTHVGTDEEITEVASRGKFAIYDLRGQFIMPGIHDAHVHMLFSGMAMLGQVKLPEQGLTNENVAEELKKGQCLCKYAHLHEDWVLGGTFLIDDYKREALDKDFPDTPVMIRGGAGHSIFLNTAAMKRSGYDIENEPDVQGSSYKRDASGALTGEMAENSLSKALLSVPKPGLAHIKQALRDAQKALHRAGVTSCQEASANTLMLKGIQELEADGALKLEMFPHIVYAPDWIGEETSASLHALIDEAERYRTKHVDTRFVKIILDGVPLAPYHSHAALKDDGSVDTSKLTILNVHDVVQKYDERGMTVKVHCTGHGATRITLDAFEAARKRNPNGPRHEVAHSSGVHDDDYARYKQLNVTAEMSPAFFFNHPLTMANSEMMGWNFAKMVAVDAHLTIGSDWGAGSLPDLLPFMAGILEAVGGGDKVAGAEKVCRMLTLSGAEAVGREKDLGSIEVGKKANFIAVDRNLAKGEFEDAKVLTTWFEGEAVYERE